MRRLVFEDNSWEDYEELRRSKRRVGRGTKPTFSFIRNGGFRSTHPTLACRTGTFALIIIS